MRPSHILAALGATTTTTTSLARAQNTSPLPDAIAQSVDCTSASTTWTLPSVSAASTHPANFTLTVDLSPANGTAAVSSEASAAASTSPPTTTTATDSTAASPSPSVAAAAAPGEGLSSDSSMLGLVVFFALSLCLL